MAASDRLHMLNLFISYSRADIRPVCSLVAALKEFGFTTWLDFEDLKPGETWKEAIRTALSRANAFVFCISPMSVRSAWTSVELRMAEQQGLAILPVMLRSVPIAELPPGLGERQVLDMERWPPSSAPHLAAKQIAEALGLDSAATGSPVRPVILHAGEGVPDIASLHGILGKELCRSARIVATGRESPFCLATLRRDLEAEDPVAIVFSESWSDREHGLFIITATAAMFGDSCPRVVEMGRSRMFERCAAVCGLLYTSFDG